MPCDRTQIPARSFLTHSLVPSYPPGPVLSHTPAAVVVVED